MRRAAALLALLSLTACDSGANHVAGPFYLMWIDISENTFLVRCPKGPDQDCVGDGLPGATAFAAGGDSRYVVVARHPRANEVTNKSVTQYFYFARIPQENGGWWDHPEKIIGPLTPQAFAADKARLHLPDFSVVLDDLK